MELIDLTQELAASETAAGVRYRREEPSEQVEATVAVEHFMDVYVNDLLTMKLVCSPCALPELVLGRLYSEGMITSLADVTQLYLCQYGSRARVTLNRQPQAERQEDFVETTGTCCTGNHVLNDVFRTGEAPKLVVPIAWEPEWFYHAASLIREGTELFNATHGVHSCYLIRKGEILLFREDLGRHNALDKVLGAALMQGIDLTECALFSSGRLPTDMIAKAIRAGIPILASKAAPTAQGIALAQSYALTLITSVRENQMIVYK